MNSNQKLKRQLGIFSALFMAIGATLGTGIVVTHGTILQAVGSIIIAIVGWVIAGVLLIPQMMIQSEMISAYPQAGGPYVMFKKARLKSVAFMFGWCFGIWGWPISIAFRAYISFTFFNNFFSLIFKDFIFNPWVLRSFAALTILIFGTITFFSVKGGAWVNNFLTIFKIVLLLFITIVAFSKFNPQNFAKEFTSIFSEGLNSFQKWIKGITFATALAIWSYNGINTVAYMAGEFKNPQKSLPIVMIFSTIIITLIYTLFVIAIGGLLSADQAIGDNTVFKAINNLAIKWLVLLLFMMLFFLSISTVFSAIKFAPRLLYAMAIDNLFFKIFKHVNNKYKTPSYAIFGNTLIATFLTFIPFSTSFIVIYFTFGTSIVNFLISLAILRCWKNSDYDPQYRLRFPKTTLSLSIICCLFAAGSGFYNSFKSFNQDWTLIFAPIWSMLVIMSAFPIYYFWNKFYIQKNQNLKLIYQDKN